MQLIKMVALDKSTHTKKGQTMKSNNIKPVQKKKTHMPMGARIAFGAMAAIAGMSSASCENPTEIEVRKRPEFHQVFWFDSSVPDNTKEQIRSAYNVLSTDDVAYLKDNFQTIEIYYEDNNFINENTFIPNGTSITIYGTPDDFVTNFNILIYSIINTPDYKFPTLGRKLDSAKQTVRLSMGKMRQGRMISFVAIDTKKNIHTKKDKP
jgi:hypothetical protein